MHTFTFRRWITFDEKITPMISSLSILNHVEMETDAEVLSYGISLILLNIGMYVGVPVAVVVGIRNRV